MCTSPHLEGVMDQGVYKVLRAQSDQLHPAWARGQVHHCQAQSSSSLLLAATYRTSSLQEAPPLCR